jgi:hypothetical protein
MGDGDGDGCITIALLVFAIMGIGGLGTRLDSIEAQNNRIETTLRSVAPVSSQ